MLNSAVRVNNQPLERRSSERARDVFR